MNPNFAHAFSPEQMVQISQLLRGRQPFPQEAPPPQSNPMPMQMYPGVMGSQMQARELQAMLQMQAHQRQAQQLAQTQIYLTGLLQDPGHRTQSQSIPLNSGAFLTGILPQQIVPTSSALLNPNPNSSTIAAPTFSADDENTFARTLWREGERQNFRDILDSLDKVNGHTKSQWLHYYMENSNKISQKIKRLGKSAQPRPRTFSPPPRSTIRHSQIISRHVPRMPREDTGHQIQNHRILRSSNSKQKTRPPPHSLRRARFRPTSGRYASRSPTPPTGVLINASGRYRYTAKDVAYLKKFLLRTLKKNSNVSRRILAQQLADRVPHHSLTSWTKYLARHHHIIEDARRQVLGYNSSSEPESYHSNSDADEVLPEELEDLKDLDEKSEGSSSDDDMNVSLSSSESEGCMRAKDKNSRSAYPPSEWRAMAKYIAEISPAKWDNRKATWSGFHKKYNRHSIHAWKQWFRKNKKEVMRMARRFEIRNEKRKEAKWEAGRGVKVETPSFNRPMSSATGSQPYESPRAGPSVPRKRMRIEDESDNESYGGEPQLPKRSRLSTETPEGSIHIEVKTAPSLVDETGNVVNLETVAGSD